MHRGALILLFAANVLANLPTVSEANHIEDASPGATDVEANKAIARRVSREIWSGGNVALIDEIITPDYARHGSDAEFTGRDALRAAILGLRAAIPDWHETIEDIVAEGNLVAYRYTGRGTYVGQFPGLPPGSGQPITIEGNALHHIVDGRVVETWSVSNTLRFLAQIGVMPAVPTTTPAAAATGDGAAGGTADTEANKVVVRQLTAIFDSADWAALDTVLAANVIDHYPDPGQAHGIAGIQQAFAALKAGFPDMTCPIEDIIPEGDRVVVRTTCKGTHTGEWNGIPASGATVTMPGLIIYRMVDRHVIDRWAQSDPFGLMMQIGAIPAGGGTPGATPAT